MYVRLLPLEPPLRASRLCDTTPLGNVAMQQVGRKTYQAAYNETAGVFVAMLLHFISYYNVLDCSLTSNPRTQQFQNENGPNIDDSDVGWFSTIVTQVHCRYKIYEATGKLWLMYEGWVLNSSALIMDSLRMVSLRLRSETI